MRYRRLGSSDLEVSELALGSWLTYGVSVEDGTARRCVDKAFDLGINFFDTANMYGKGAAESVLGELLARRRRDSYILATKVYFPMSNEDRGLSRKQIHKQLDASLKRLGTDYVDLYYCHRYDEETPLEETMLALGEVVAAGKVRYVGFSRWKTRQLRASRKIEGAPRFVASQPQYSLLHRTPESRVFPTCEKYGIGQVVYSPLAQGVLTGKYRPSEEAPDGSRGADPKLRRSSKRFDDPKILSAVQRLHPIAQRLSLSMSQLALAWILRDARVASAILGASRPEQIEENVGAVGVRLDDSTLSEIDEALAEVVRR